jgi:hypothetical protein
MIICRYERFKTKLLERWEIMYHVCGNILNKEKYGKEVIKKDINNCGEGVDCGEKCLYFKGGISNYVWFNEKEK